MASVFTDWTDQHSDDYGKKPILVGHNVHERQMFTDDGLADLLDRYPREKLSVYTMGDDPENWRSFVHGDPGDLSGAELLEAVKNGRIWFNLRAANHELDDYRELCDELFGELDAKTGEKTLKHDLGVLISSPKVQVFYHLDIPLVTLWQVRGVKRVWIYPETPRFASDECIEGIILKETEEEFEFNPSFDDHAFVVDLEPGQMANWPQNAPHRIENHDMINVSLSVEYMSWPAIVHANAMYTNGILRRRFGLHPNRLNDAGAKKWVKAGAARVIKTAIGRNAFSNYKAPQFKVDLNAEGAVSFY